MSTRTLIIWILGGLAGVVLVSYAAWFFLFRSVAAPATNTVSQSQGLGTATTQTTGVSPSASSNTTNGTVDLSGANTQKVFKIADGPVSGATFTQTFSPTTTLARYVLAENGHVMDQPIDVPGSLPRAVSNTTIPGTEEVLWAEGGGAAVFQYQDSATIKTLSLSIPSATSSKSITRPVSIQFLPDNATAVALDPSGTRVAYLLQSGMGSDGYISNIDGSNTKKIFSIGFVQLLLSWPAPGTLLVATKSASGVPGIVLSADTKTGALLPLIYATGLTASADGSFSNVVYRTDSSGTPASYLHNIKRNIDVSLSFDPIPEKCAWGNVATSTLYCATPAKSIGTNYLDLWHLGLQSVPDLILSFMPLQNSATNAIATPGSSDGGVQSDILSVAVSPDDKYLLFIKKGDRSLWGVRLSQ